MSSQTTDDRLMFIASNLDSLGDFLKTNIAEGKHIYCSVNSDLISSDFLLDLQRKKALSIRFIDGVQIEPPFIIEKG
ncbi:hypothetical protein [Vibrio coralliilyticus]|uniref:hypothetical protein n=1 Tax=Vibrio coralliilyticus TaxID=190893 RepID=UPI000C164179|nr:hypothetical protein [Vibrio coralliilyticus]